MPYSRAQMYALVSDIDSYSDFLPWCPGSRIEERDGNRLKARIAYRWNGIEGSFVTRNTNVPNSSITMESCEGPFKDLQGQWLFSPLTQRACKLQFRLSFSFRGPLHAVTMGPLFKRLTSSLLDAFLKRAQSLY